ncbi:GNAT family N-acetyltransferase, partial [Legionella tunisiensis]|uniref:GNAT family N-acetyltransferase n=1 Tax=Legionella tunisiensis TaxID=1034944 RepID=UPI0018DB18C6
MFSFDEIVSEEVDLKDILSESLTKALGDSNFQLQLLEEGTAEVAEADLLLEEVFPKGEVEDYKPSQLLSYVDNALSMICLKGGVIIGSITVGCNLDDGKYMVVHSLVVDREYRNKKLGSVLMLAVHDIACELGINSVSLISSGYGKPFYQSFGLL